jgi:hypothetical protein
MNLLVALVITFPGTRIASLPTGRTLEPGVWQLGIGHRWLSTENNDILRGNPMNIITDANVLFWVDRGITDQLTLGAYGGNRSHAVGVRATWAASRWTVVHASAWTDVVDLGLGSTWTNVGLAVPFTIRSRLHFVLLPRAATNFDKLTGSVGAGVKVGFDDGWSVAAETEPVLVGESDLLAWNLAACKQLGWHDFALTIGNAWDQVEPLWYTTANRDITKGLFRVGFHILRKL